MQSALLMFFDLNFQAGLRARYSYSSRYLMKKGQDIIDDLKKNFNTLLYELYQNSSAGTSDFFSRLTLSDLVRIKKDIAGINSLVTMMASVAFIDILRRYHLIKDNEHDEMIAQIRETSPYANGYDVRCDKAKIVAEVKCNAPVKGNAFGAAQMRQLIKDIKGLHDHSYKSKEKESVTGYKKFMVMLDEGKSDFRAALENLIAHVKNLNNGIKIELFDKMSKPLDDDTIYIVTVPLSELEISILT